MITLTNLMLTVFDAAFRTLLMLASMIAIDFFIPGEFAEEFRRDNSAVAWLSAGSFIGIGVILRNVIISPAYDAVPPDFLQGVLASALYAAIGIICFVCGFFVINAWHRKYGLAEEIKRGNTAAGILVFGIFVGLSLVISGAVH